MDAKTERIKSRIAARKLAAELVGLCEYEDGTGADFAESLLKEMAGLLPKRRQPEPEKPIPFARLAATVMPFGEHKGKPLEQVPTDYLDWLCRSQEEFYRTLRAYLVHPERR